MNRKVTKHYLAIAIILRLTPGSSSAAQVEDTYFHDLYSEGNVELRIRGTGILRYMIFVKAYAGGLYLPEDVSSDDVLSEVPKRLQVEYFHPINGEDFGPATREMIAKNVDALTFERLKPKIELHSRMYEDVKPGDRYSLT
jgi:hypothetical protein